MEKKIINIKSRRTKGRIEQVLKNRRVVVSRCKDKEDTQCFLFRFKVLTDNPSPRYEVDHIKGKIMQTSIALTEESTIALYTALREIIEPYLTINEK